MNLIERLRKTWNPSPELMLEAADALERLTAERDSLKEALRIMLLQSPYQDGEGGHRYQACQMAQDALDHVPNVGKMVGQGAQGCTYCSHPLYAGVKCKNCGRVTDNDDIALLRMALEAMDDAQGYIEAELNNRMDLYKGYPNLAYKYESEQRSLQQNQEAITALRERLGEVK